MATTAYSSTGASLSVSGYTFGIDGAVNYDSISRSNNTISVSGANSRCKITGPSGGWFSGFTVKTAYQFPTGTTRRTQDLGSGRFDVGDDLGSSENNFSFSVDADDTSVSVRAGGAYGSDGISWQSSKSMSIPSLGSPAGTTTIDTRLSVSISVRNNVTSWGSNATSGSVRSYRSVNSDFSGQTYISTTDNALVNHTGLTSNTRYYFRGWAQNGGGKSAYHSSTNGYTLPLSCVAGTPTVDAATASIPITQDNGGGAYAITRQYRIKQGAGDYGAWITFVGDTLNLTGLIPSTDYQVQLQSVTTAGTTVGAVTSFTTLPAAKLVYPNGDVKNAIPRTVMPNGDVAMRKVTIVEGA